MDQPQSDLTHAAEQFSSLLSDLRGSVPALSPARIQAAMDDRPATIDQTDHLANYIASNCSLTLEEARPLAAAAISSNPGNTAAAAQHVASSVSALTGSATLKLSNPMPLPRWCRVTASVVMAGLAAVAIVYMGISHSTGTAEYVALGVAAGLGWLGVIIFVMGYQTVSIEGSSGSPGGAGSA